MPTRSRFFLSVNRNAAFSTVGSASSTPRIAFNTRAQSSADRAIGPILSNVQQSAIAPARLTLPKEGRRPVVPQTLDGETMDPNVSLPTANGTRPAATAEAEP